MAISSFLYFLLVLRTPYLHVMADSQFHLRTNFWHVIFVLLLLLNLKKKLRCEKSVFACLQTFEKIKMNCRLAGRSFGRENPYTQTSMFLKPDLDVLKT